MFRDRTKKAKKGFVLIYALFIGLVCILIAITCYNMETLVKSNNMSNYNSSFKVEDIQQSREKLLTKLNLYINESIEYKSDEDINKHFLNLKDFRIYYEKSYIYYDKDNDIFKLEYIVNNKPYREESYEYKIEKGQIKYGCINYSY